MKGTVHEIKEIHLPEDWEWNYKKSGHHKASELGQYDLAILVMKTPFIFTMKVKPINIHIEQKHIRKLKGSMNLEVYDLNFFLISILSLKIKKGVIQQDGVGSIKINQKPMMGGLLMGNFRKL